MANTESVKDVNASATPSSKNRDKWDILDIFMRPAAAFLTALTIAAIGLMGQCSLKDAQRNETERTKITQNYRLYSELLSKREDSESALRKDMFSTILKQFFQIPDNNGEQVDVEKRLLKLEMLALNFGDALSLSPLFIELDKDIDTHNYPEETEEIYRARDRLRLHSLAKRVSQQQLSALSTGGKYWDFDIEIKKISAGQSAKWPGDNDSNEKKLNDIKRNYTFTFSQVDETYKTVIVDLEIQNTGESEVIEVIERSFALNYFNFPMVDNTRLSNDQRFALIMTNFGESVIHFVAISFPGKYSSQRDKPFLDDVIHRLKRDAVKESATDKLGKEKKI